MKLLLRAAFLGGLLVLSDLGCSLGSAESSASVAWQRFSAQAQAALGSTDSRASVARAVETDAPLLQFSQFFGPIGDRGLEYSDGLRACEGRRVRLSGYMVREQNRAPGVFLLTARPARVQQSDYCTYDDLPTAVAHVVLPSAADVPVPFQPGRIELVGTLELGSRVEADGRNSSVRLVLDRDTATSLLGDSLVRDRLTGLSTPSSLNSQIQ